METHFLAPYFSAQTIQAICWTLIHSLWIGLLIAALAGLVIALTKKSSSNLRYRLLCGLLFVFVAATLFTFYRELDKAPFRVSPVGTGIGQSQGALTAPVNGILPVSPLNFNGVIVFLNRWSGWIFTLWVVICIFKSIKLSRELLYVNRVRHTGVVEAGEEWTTKVWSFSEKLGVRRMVTLLESALVKVPVTIGYFKPVILLPAGMLLQLPPGQIDTILWHELAHILRRDYLVNILQSIVETLFFFNPAVWWLSTLIREERETCCDDIVLANVQQKRNYLEALIAFQNYENQPGTYAMGLSLRRKPLMNRLKRMVSHENQKLNAAEKVVLLCGVVLCSAFTFIPEVKPEVKKGLAYVTETISRVIAPGPYRDNGDTATPRPRKRIIPPPVAQATISADTVDHIAKLSFRFSNADLANCEMDAVDDKGNRYYIKLVNGQAAALTVNDQVIAPQQFAGYQALVSQVSAHAYAARRQKAERMLARQQHPELYPPAPKPKHKDTTGLNGPIAKAKHRDTTGLKTHNLKRLATGAAGKAARKDSTAAAQQVTRKKKLEGLPPDFPQQQARVRGVIAALVREKVVNDAAAIDWFGLSDDELIVNGKKQPEALHQKLKEQFGIKPHNGLYYGEGKMNGTGVFLNKGDL